MKSPFNPFCKWLWVGFKTRREAWLDQLKREQLQASRAAVADKIKFVLFWLKQIANKVAPKLDRSASRSCCDKSIFSLKLGLSFVGIYLQTDRKVVQLCESWYVVQSLLGFNIVQSWLLFFIVFFSCVIYQQIGYFQIRQLYEVFV